MHHHVLRDPDFMVDALRAAADMAQRAALEVGLIVDGLTGSPTSLPPAIIALREESRRPRTTRKSPRGKRIKD
jgi:hypothetical protein